jgi:hypothetical protein
MNMRIVNDNPKEGTMTVLAATDLRHVFGGEARAELRKSLEDCTIDGNCTAPTQEQAKAALSAFDAAGYERHLALHQLLAGGAPLAPWQKKP